MRYTPAGTGLVLFSARRTKDGRARRVQVPLFWDDEKGRLTAEYWTGSRHRRYLVQRRQYPRPELVATQIVR